MRDYIIFYLNNQKKIVKGDDCFLPLSTFLREKEQMNGTKVVCAEGDCGACTVLRGTFFPNLKEMRFQTINSCIYPLFLVDGCHIVTIEGLGNGDELGPVQKSMVEHHGTQCGYCTPGFVASLSAVALDKKKLTEKNVKNYLTGNLCRCTGYKGIIEAGISINPKDVQKQFKKYLKESIVLELKKELDKEVSIKGKEGRTLFLPKTLASAVKYKKDKKQVKILSSGTDLYVLFNKEKWQPLDLISLQMVKDLYQIKEDRRKKEVIIGARVSLTETGNYLENKTREFSDLINVFASPQIKNAGTLVGNIANASPIGDTLPFLLVAEARLRLISSKGERFVEMTDFYKGYKEMDLSPEEIISHVHIPLIPQYVDLKIYKVAKRKDLDISTVSMAIYMKRDKINKIEELRIAYGGVAATPIRIKKLEKWSRGKIFSHETLEKMAILLKEELHPLSDVRGTDEYREMLIENLLRKAYLEIIQSKGGADDERK